MRFPSPTTLTSLLLLTTAITAGACSTEVSGTGTSGTTDRNENGDSTGDGDSIGEGGSTGDGDGDPATGGTEQTVPLSLSAKDFTLSFNQSTELRLETEGGGGAPRFALAADAELPGGLELSEDGTISGRPTVAGEFEVELVVSENGGEEITATVKFTVERSKRWVAYLADHELFGRSELYIYDLLNTAQAPRRVVFESLGNVDAFLFSPDGQKIAAQVSRSGERSEVFIVDSASGTHEIVSGAEKVTELFAWSPDGSKLTYGGTADGPPNLYLADPSGENESELLMAFDGSSPVRETLWVENERLFIATSSYLYSADVSDFTMPGTPSQLVIPNVAVLPSPPVFTRPTNEDEVLFFRLGGPDTGQLYSIDFRGGSGTISKLHDIFGTTWAPSPDGSLFYHREATGMSFNSIGPIVRKLADTDDVWNPMFDAQARWGFQDNTLFWAKNDGTEEIYELHQTTFGDINSVDVHSALPESMRVHAVAADDEHVILLGNDLESPVLGLHGPDGFATVFEGETSIEGFAPDARLLAFRDGSSALHVARTDNTADSLWAPTAQNDEVGSYQWTADSAVLLYTAEGTGRGLQLYRAEVLDGKPKGQSVHALKNCAGDNCPMVSSFAVQP